MDQGFSSSIRTLRQWLNYSKVGGGTVHFLPSLSHPSLSLPSLRSLSLPSLLLPPLRSRPLKSS